MHRADGITINVACPHSIAIPDLVSIFENVLDIRAVCDTIEAGASYDIDTTLTAEVAEEAGVLFDPHYVKNLIQKYYANSSQTSSLFGDSGIRQRESATRIGVTPGDNTRPSRAPTQTL
jgi:hypothetical protein